MAALVLQRCRICADAHDAGVMIFGSEGHEMMLRDNILKFLQVEVALDDDLPKMVCIKCCTQIDSIRVFAEMAKQAQISLRKHVEMMNHVNNHEASEISNYYKLNSFDGEHDSKENHVNNQYNDEDVTELEVRIDPMMFLDSHTDEDSQTSTNGYGNDIASISPEEECATLTKIENRPESLTIELVPMPIKPEFEKKLKAIPDLKPIKLSKKFDPAENIRPYTCSACPRSFYSSIALQNHSWLHSNSKSVEVVSNGRIRCPVCRKDMSNKTNLKIHMESHKAKGRYTCDICGRVFKTQSNLLRHKEYHGGEVYTCNDCGRVYPTNSTLRAHSVTHSDARPHNCPLCKKTFKRNQDLKFHINQHTGARPYRCPYCPKAFASSGNCFSHRKRMHPVEVERDREKSTIDS